MATATAAQTTVYQFHKRLLTGGIPGVGRISQSTHEHLGLQGSMSPPSASGNIVYSGPGSLTADPVTTTTKVWAVTRPMPVRGGASHGSDTEFGKQSLPLQQGQFPAINDYGDTFAVSHNDYLIDPGGTKYRIENPSLDPANTLWSFNLVKAR